MLKGWSAEESFAYWREKWTVYDHPHWVSAVCALRASKEREQEMTALQQAAKTAPCVFTIL